MTYSNLFITPLYTSILAIIFVGLSIQVIRLRRRLKVSLGVDSTAFKHSTVTNNKDLTESSYQELLLRAVRVQANFAEYVPLTVILIMCAEINGAPNEILHGLFILLLIGRISHAYGMSRLNEVFKYRVLGMAMTLTVILMSASYLLYNYIHTLY